VAVVLIGLILAAMIAVSATGAVLVRRPFPQGSGTLTLQGLSSSVTVVRNASGIPDIYAGSAHDLFLAQGYVQAQDRFFQMDFRRHVTAGRLSEMFGSATVDTDMFIRTMGWRQVALKELSMLSPESLSYLQAYSAGVNAYINSHSLSQMSVEYSLLGLTGLNYKVEQWTPLDSITWLKAMAWDLRGNMTDEIDRALGAAVLTPSQQADLYPPYPYQTHRPILRSGDVVNGTFDARVPTGQAQLFKSVAGLLEQTAAAADSLPTLVGTGDGVGSNSWVVNGAHSATGMPLLANDPHLGISVPGVWYQMGLHCTQLSDSCPFDVSGYTFAGMPGVVIGHNASIAWGFTNLGPDVTDLYLEKIQDQTYLYDGNWLPLKLHDETIKVANGTDVTFTVRSTPHGPLLSDVSTQLSTVGADAPVGDGAPPRDAGYAVALEWTGLIPSNTVDAIFEVDQATDWTSFRQAAADFAVPAQNMIYADTQGHIGYQAPGMIPIRQPGDSGKLPVAGWDPHNDWTGKFIPFEALPSVLDPAEGYIVTANQAVVGPKYPYFLTDDWDYGYRSQRIFDMLASQKNFGVADFTTMQFDQLNNFASTLVPYLLSVKMPRGYYSQGQALLKNWDGQQSVDSAAAAYFNVVWSHLLADTFDDQLPEALWPDGSSRWYAVMAALLQDPNSSWWDDTTTDGVVETRDDMLARAMTEARDELTRRESESPSNWTWGGLHVLNLQNQPLGTVGNGLVDWLLNRGGYQVGGGEATVDATGWDATKGYGVDWAPSMRMVVDLSNLDNSRWVNLTGTSGHAFASNYVDQTKLWATGQTLPWAFSKDQVQFGGAEVLTLLPAT
jgi:penicillin amidase